MKVVHARPPMFDRIHAAFPEASKPGVIFTWGDTIYAPSGGMPSAWLRAHEGVHFSRQTAPGMTPESWWERYIVDPEFRFAEELPAHRAEYRAFCNAVRDRNQRSRFLATVAERLSGPLYGRMLTMTNARMEIAR
jgi:hypothetical protein